MSSGVEPSQMSSFSSTGPNYILWLHRGPLWSCYINSVNAFFGSDGTLHITLPTIPVTLNFHSKTRHAARSSLTYFWRKTLGNLKPKPTYTNSGQNCFFIHLYAEHKTKAVMRLKSLKKVPILFNIIFRHWKNTIKNHTRHIMVTSLRSVYLK